MDGRSRSILERGRLACCCLLVETNDAPVPIDTVLGLRDVADPHGRLSRFFLAPVRPVFREELTTRRQIERLGFAAEDMRLIILTRLDFDHAGGLDDLHHAAVHMLAQEREYAKLQKTWRDRQRFRPQQWSTRGQWRTYRAGRGGTWLGFQQVRETCRACRRKSS